MARAPEFYSHNPKVDQFILDQGFLNGEYIKSRGNGERPKHSRMVETISKGLKTDMYQGRAANHIKQSRQLYDAKERMRAKLQNKAEK